MAVSTPPRPCPPKTKIIADATDANAASGATAAPMFAQPNAIICNDPPKIIHASKLPVTRPINVHATSGWWNWNSSKIPSIPAKKATTTTNTIDIIDMIDLLFSCILFTCSTIRFSLYAKFHPCCRVNRLVLYAHQI